MGALIRFSYLLLSLVLVAAAAVTTVAMQWWGAGQIGTMILAAILIIYWIMARRGDLTPAEPEKKLRRSRASGRPVAVLFYSDFHLASLLRRASESHIEQEFKGRCEFIHMSALHPEARALMEKLNVGVGDWVFFDQTGKTGGQGRLTADQLRRFAA